MSRELTDLDLAAWAAYAQSVVPLAGRVRPPLAAEPEPPAPVLAPSPRARKRPARTGPVSIGDHPPGVDKATWQRFRTGKLPISRTLDLHGHTTQWAFRAVVTFLRSAHADRVRCVEIITGRGAGEQGVIRREFPLWLNLPELRPLVLAATHPHAANPGAVRLLLSRR